MKALSILFLCAGFLLLSTASAQSTDKASMPKRPDGCQGCATTPVTSHDPAPAVKQIPGTDETMVVGKIENLIPIGMLTVLGCEKCSAEAVNWALQQGSSFDDVERTLRTVSSVQKLDCFKDKFGPEITARMEKTLVAAQQALADARTRAGK